MDSNKCGIGYYTEAELTSLSTLERMRWGLASLADAISEQLAWMMSIGKKPRITPTRTILVAVHVLQQESDTRPASVWHALIDTQIDALNRDFSALDSGIRFELDREASQIVQVKDNVVMDSKKARECAPPVDGRRVLNVWVGNLSASYGYADYPWWARRSIHGVFIQTTCFGISNAVTIAHNQGKVCTHEVGHWLGLEHVADDSLNDTKKKMSTNFMDDTSYDLYWKTFSPRQISRMRYYLARHRRGTFR